MEKETDMKLYAERFQSALQILRKRMAQDFTKQVNFGLTLPQFYILYMIREKGTCKVTALAEDMEVKPSAITVMIDRLVNHNFVERLADINDRRVVLLRITEVGLNAVNEIEQRNNEMIGNYFNKLSTSEVENMIQTLEKMLKN
jgi:DNA-binding MarR family transcriptional regulator